MIDRYQLRYFLAVVDAGNFSRAAALANVAQPTLSVGIAKLEEAVGARLFFRNAQRVSLTEAGVRFLGHARAIEREFAALEAPDPGAADASLIRLGVLSTLPSPLIEALVRTHIQAQPSVRLEIVEGLERDLTSRLARGRLDAALSLIRPGDARYSHIALYEEGYGLALGADHPLASETLLAAEALSAEVMIVRRHCEALPETSRHFTERGVRPSFSFRSTNDDKVMAMVRAKLGLTVMPDTFIAEGVVRPRLAGFDVRRRIGLVHAEGAEAPAKALAAEFRQALEVAGLSGLVKWAPGFGG